MGKQCVGFVLSVYLRRGGRGTDTNCLTDLHSVFICPATELVEGAVFERKHALTLNKQFSQKKKEKKRSSYSPIHTFCLPAAVKAEAHTHWDVVGAVPLVTSDRTRVTSISTLAL